MFVKDVKVIDLLEWGNESNLQILRNLPFISYFLGTYS